MVGLYIINNASRKPNVIDLNVADNPRGYKIVPIKESIMYLSICLNLLIFNSK